MKKITTIALLAFLFTGCFNSTTNKASKFKTFMIKSVGKVETLPDMATFYINLSCLDQSVKASKKCLVDKSNELNSQLLAFGISQEDLLTTSVDLHKSYTWRNNTNVFEGYKSSTRMFVTVRDLDKLGEIYTNLLENQNLDLGGLAYSHSAIDSLENEAYTDALKKAGLLADKLLAEIPETKKEVLKIGNVEITSSMPEAGETEFRSNADDLWFYETNVRKDQSISISKGTVIVYATLFVEYHVTP